MAVQAYNKLHKTRQNHGNVCCLENYLVDRVFIKCNHLILFNSGSQLTGSIINIKHYPKLVSKYLFN